MTSSQSIGEIALSPSTTLRVLAMTVDRVVFAKQKQNDFRTTQHPHCHCEAGAEQVTKQSRFKLTTNFKAKSSRFGLRVDQINFIYPLLINPGRFQLDLLLIGHDIDDIFPPTYGQHKI